MARLDKVGTYATSIRTDGKGNTMLRYHDTDVVTVNTNSIKLDTGGWFTNTTKTRMNQFSNQYNLGFYVQQKAGKWYIHYGDIVIPFKDYPSVSFSRIPDAELRETVKYYAKLNEK